MLKNKIVLITGASSGIGAASAKQFAQQGAKLLLSARRLPLIQKLADELHAAYGATIYPFQLDVREPAQVKQAINELPSEWKKIDVLLNNAGLAAGLDPLPEGHLEDWENMINTNLKGLLYVTQAVLPTMLNHNEGHIINIGSIAGHEIYPKGAVYCATKAAVKTLTQGLRMDLLGTQIRVSTVDPGAVHTQFSEVRFKGDSKRANAVYEGMQPLTPDDIADAIIYCATRPLHVNISEIIIMPTDQASATLIARKPVSKVE